MTVLTRASNGKSVSLGNQIASSGEGEVWETNQSGILAKIYHNPTPERIEKLKVMLANPPIDPMASQNHVSIAFPQDLLKNQNGAYVGFLMPAIRHSRELTSVYNPSLRKRKAPGFNWYYLHATALNTAWIIQAIHDKGYVLGDIKPQNILVSDRALVAVIDTDSFQVRDSHTGKVYRCTVGSEGFTPVELLGKDFSTTDQTEICDRFRLAVLIHYLLFGYHPFSGQWVGSGESPEQSELIRKGFWYGGNNSLIRPSLNTIPLDIVHPEIKQCFLKCFNDGHTSPHLRPTAEDWHNALEVAVNDLTACDKVNNHIYTQHYGKCYWCERAAKLNVDIFPGAAGTAQIPTFKGSSNTAATTVKTITNPSTVIQTVPYSTPSNQTLIQPASLPSGNSPPTIPSSQPSPTKGLLEWQKAVITGSMIGIWVVFGLFATRQQSPSTQTSTQQSVVEQNISSPSSDSSEQEQTSSHSSVEQNISSSSSDSSEQKPSLQLSLSEFPKVSCGDPLPSNSSDYPINFYPVFVPYSDDNLAKASSHFCQDSLKKRRKDTGEIVVQVSSFTSKEKAILFAVFIRSEFEYTMVGEPTVIKEKPF